MRRIHSIGKRDNIYIVETNIETHYSQDMASAYPNFEDLPPQVIANQDLRYVWLTQETQFSSFSGALNYMLTDATVPELRKDYIPKNCNEIPGDDKLLLERIINKFSALKKIKDITNKL